MRINIIYFKKNILNPLKNINHINKILVIGPNYVSNILYNKLNQNYLSKVKILEVDESHVYPAYIRNIGIDISQDLNSQITLFIDDDIVIKNNLSIINLNKKDN